MLHLLRQIQPSRVIQAPFVNGPPMLVKQPQPLLSPIHAMTKGEIGTPGGEPESFGPLPPSRFAVPNASRSRATADNRFHNPSAHQSSSHIPPIYVNSRSTTASRFTTPFHA